MEDRFEALERLARLRQLDVLSPEEFAAEKARILTSGQTDSPPSTSDAGKQQEKRRRLQWAVAGGLSALAGAALAYAAIIDVKNFPSGEREAKAENPAPTGGDGGDMAGDLAGLLAFDDPKKCEPGHNLKTLGNRMTGLQEESSGGIAVPGFADPMTVRSGQAEADAGDATIVYLPMNGTWNGLRVRGVRTVTWDGSQVVSLQIRFSETAERVRRALTAEGFALPPVAQLKQVEGKTKVLIGVENIADGSALTCARIL